MSSHIHIHTQKCIRTCFKHAHFHTHVRMHARTSEIHIHIHNPHSRVHTHIYIHKHTHIHTYFHARTHLDDQCCHPLPTPLMPSSPARVHTLLVHAEQLPAQLDGVRCPHVHLQSRNYILSCFVCLCVCVCVCACVYVCVLV